MNQKPDYGPAGCCGPSTLAFLLAVLAALALLVGCGVTDPVEHVEPRPAVMPGPEPKGWGR